MFSNQLAKRYFFAKKKTTFIHVISRIAMLGIGLGTMALIIVLSVFNGLEELNRNIFRSFDPAIKISLQKGRFFEANTQIIKALQKIDGVENVMMVLEDHALATYADKQTVVKFKGVDQSFVTLGKLKPNVLEGGTLSLEKNQGPAAFMGVSVAQELGVDIDFDFENLSLIYPDKDAKIMTESALSQVSLPIAGIFMLEHTHDNYIYLPLDLAQQLCHENGLSAIEIEGKNIDIPAIKKLMGSHFDVKTNEELNLDLFRAIKIEKIFIFIALTMITAVAAFNIFFSLSLLVIEKKDNIRTLSAMGATKPTLQKIFFKEGLWVAFSGAFVGMVLGICVVWAQQEWKIVKMGMQTAIVDAYPVVLKFSDVLICGFSLILIGIAAAYFPSKKAANFGYE